MFTSIDCYPKKRGCRGSRGRATSFPGFSPTLGTRLGDPLPGTWKAGLEGEKKDARSHHPSLVLLACLACSRVPQSPLVKEADTKACVSWGKAFHKLLEIFQKVSRNFSKSCSKVAKKKNNQKLLFALTKVAQKLLKKTKTSFGLMLKNAICTTKVRFLSIFVQFCGVTSVAK